jgi:hypothetical protein
MANTELVYPLLNHRITGTLLKVIKTAKPAVLCPNGRASSLRLGLAATFPQKIIRSKLQMNLQKEVFTQ